VDAEHAGRGYLALPDGGSGPGVLVLHSWWGLTPFFRDLCDRLAAEGFVALAPDLFAGALPDDVEGAEALLQGADANELAHLTRSSLQTLLDLPATPDGPVAVVGFSMGASLGLWLSARVVDAIVATVAFYGGQDIDFVDATSAYLGHYAGEPDPYVDDDSLVLLEADLHLLGLDTTFHRYPGAGHWFFEADRPEHDPDAAALAWDRTVAFLHHHLG
jgi:carboxymethylenebutenolidase